MRLLMFALLALSTLPCSWASTPIIRNELREVKQLLIVVTENWASTKGKLVCFEKRLNGTWSSVFQEHFPVLLGKNGLAWGIGVHPTQKEKMKIEGDGRSPAGIFKVGKVYGESESLPKGSDYPYHKISEYDAWVDDPKNPFYNQHVKIEKLKDKPDWFESQRMRLGDPAYRWLIEIRHNSNLPKPGYGSAIFFHVRRTPERRTTGCTVMSINDIENLIKFLKEKKKPHYILLPRKEYDKRRPLYKFPKL